jgi:hypothetical protein
MTTQSSRFKKGSGVYVCSCCKHTTRDTGGDGAGVGCCDICFELAGEENHISDSGGSLYGTKEQVRAMLAALDKRNGNSSAQTHFPEVCVAAEYKG